jgi:DNA-binding MarR family transcriptional regulator
VIFELAGRDHLDATELRRMLDIDAGYLSRVPARLEGGQLISRQRPAGDGRRLEIGLIEQGQGCLPDAGNALRQPDQRVACPALRRRPAQAD